jgi:hypothetical protein
LIIAWHVINLQAAQVIVTALLYSHATSVIECVASESLSQAHNTGQAEGKEFQPTNNQNKQIPSASKLHIFHLRALRLL